MTRLNYVKDQELWMLNDSHHLLTEMRSDLSITPVLQQRMIPFMTKDRYDHDCIAVKTTVREAYNLCHMTNGKTVMKILRLYADGQDHHYSEISAVLFPGKGPGHDIDSFKSLINRGMVKFAGKGKRGRMLYKITPFGQEILKICDMNDVYYKPMRWFCMDEDEMFTNMLKADMGDDDTGYDTSPEALLNLMKQIFDVNSPIAKLGSRYRWFNKFMQKLLTNQSFYETVNAPETNAWLDEHKDDPEVSKFYIKWKKTQQKWAKKLAA